MRGVIEGFYGPFYTHPERLSLLGFLGARGFNLYLYAPKNDRQHRARWRQPYPEKILAQFGEAVVVARQAGLEFGYALGPGIDVSYASDEDFGAIKRKFRNFFDLGVRTFSLALDDISNTFSHEEDRARYDSYAQAQADLCNRVHAWLGSLRESCTLSMCPTTYHGVAPFPPYLHELGTALNPEIDLFYTGPEVCSKMLTATDVGAFAEAARREPLLWDNYPVNDLAMQGELHIGPVRYRDPELHRVAKGVLVNPMLQAEASKVPLATFADYFDNPTAYDPEASWEQALMDVASEESVPALRLLAENSLHSCLGTPEAARLEGLVSHVLTELEREGTQGPAVQALQAYLSDLDEACYHLKFRMDNLALRNELLPWIELLEHWLWLGRNSLELLAAQAEERDVSRPLREVRELLGKAVNHPKRIAGRVLEPLAQLALERAQGIRA